jgi:branched-chain amino acid transport system substrate-binding protein
MFSIGILIMDRIMKTVLGIAIVLAIILVVSFGISLDSGMSGNSISQDKIKIGITAPLTGPLAEYGIAVVNGVELAKEDLGSEAEKFEFIIEDTAYDGKQAISAYTKLATVDKVDLVFDWGVAPNEAVAPIVDSYQVPYIGASFANGITQNREYVIRYGNRAEELSLRILEYMRANGYKKAGILKTQLAFFDFIHEGLDKHKRADEEIIVTSSPP